jgi:RNA polymerase sigma factor (sigma-70 family)
MDSTDARVTTMTSKATDGELFFLVAARGDACNEACAEIYRRYFEDLCKDISKRHKCIPQSMIEGLAQDALIRAIEKAHDFKEGDVSDAKSARSHTLSYLRTIAFHKYQSRQLKQRGVIFESLTQEDGEDDSQLSTKGRRLSPGELYRVIKDAEDEVYGSGNDDHTSLLMRLLCEALDSLRYIERCVLVVTYENYQYGQDHQRLPNDVVKETAETLNISHDYVRQLRKRAINKIKKYVKTHMPTENGTP